MLFSDKLQSIYEENKHNNLVLHEKLKNAISEELQSAIGRGENYNLKTHIIRMRNAWVLFSKDKPTIRETGLEDLIRKASPDIAKKVFGK
jgi:hypothetical protein